MHLPPKEAGLAEKRINDSGVSSSISRAGKNAIDLALTMTPATSASPPTTTTASSVPVATHLTWHRGSFCSKIQTMDLRAKCRSGGAGAPYVVGSDPWIRWRRKKNLLYFVSSSGGGEATGDEGTGYSRRCGAERSGSAAGRAPTSEQHQPSGGAGRRDRSPLHGEVRCPSAKMAAQSTSMYADQTKVVQATPRTPPSRRASPASCITNAGTMFFHSSTGSDTDPVQKQRVFTLQDMQWPHSNGER